MCSSWGLVVARTTKRLKAMGDLSTQILQNTFFFLRRQVVHGLQPLLAKGAPRDIQALLAITVFTGMGTKLAAVRHGWREGDATTAAAISDWAAIACDRDALVFFHFGMRGF